LRHRRRAGDGHSFPQGTDNSLVAMRGYIDWELELVAQLERDGTHWFRVI
jgi:hypothetical protein